MPHAVSHSLPSEIIPVSIRDRVFLDSGILYVSEELQGKPELVQFIAINRVRGNKIFTYLPPEEFNEKNNELNKSKDIDATNDNEVEKVIKKILNAAYSKHASDIHVLDKGAYTIVRTRIHGQLIDFETYPKELGKAVQRVFYSKSSSTSRPEMSVEHRLESRIVGSDILPKAIHSARLHTEPTETQPREKAASMFLRLLYDSTKASGTLEQRMGQLGFTEQQIRTLRYLTARTGLVVLSGPTGHGKSTALVHLMESMAAENPGKCFVSVEDPPEYPIRGVIQFLVSTATDEESSLEELAKRYNDAIAGTMRSDLDVCMIGEMRYPETVKAAINIAMSGHSVYSTFHANNALGIVSRMVNFLTSAGASYQEALETVCDVNVLAGLVYQRLLPVLCPECKRKMTQGDEYPEDIKTRLAGKGIEEFYVVGPGCSHCNKMGIVGQTVAAEVIAVDPEMLALLRTPGTGIQQAREYWLQDKQGQTYVQHAIELIRQGLVDPIRAEERLGVPIDFETQR